MQLDAVRAFTSGDYATAKTLFESVLAMDPKNNSAKTYLKMIAVKEREDGGLEVSLKKIMIPKVDLHDASVREAIAFVSQKVKEASQGKTTVNVVWLVPPSDEGTVTLSLENVPASEVLQYIADIAKLKLEYDQLALKIKPATASTADAATQAPAAPKTN